MKRKISLIVSIIFCLAFCSMNIVKSSIRDIRFLLTLSSETLANAEAIDGDNEGGEKTECPPEFNFNQIHSIEEKWQNVLCVRMGQIELPGYTLHGYYYKGSYYTIHYKQHSCKEQKGSCCENTMGIEIIYD